MEIRAAHRFARISPRKVRPVMSAIAGRRVGEVIALLGASPRRAAALVGKVVRSAAANAENNDLIECEPEEMYITSARVDDGPRMRRHKFGARGRVKPRVKRMSHITIGLTEKREEADGAEG